MMCSVSSTEVSNRSLALPIMLRKEMNMHRQLSSWSLLWLLIAGLSLSGCGGMRLQLHNASVEAPSNVAMYFSVHDAEGEPLGGLTAEEFDIYEDGQLISQFESQQTILNPEVATVRYTLLLLDMSGSVTESGQVPLIQEAASAFIDNVGEQEELAVYAFDGRAEIQPISEFDDRQAQSAARVARLGSWNAEDPSTNLYGATIEGARVLSEARAQSELPLHFGTLVIFTDGTDRAHRATLGQAMRALPPDTRVYTIGLGGEVDQEVLADLGRDGYFHAESGEGMVQVFQEVAEQIQALSQAFYLLSYCSPSRAGFHSLEIELVRGEESGSLSYRFDATGFEPDCDPEDPPQEFVVPGLEDEQRRGSRSRR